MNNDRELYTITWHSSDTNEYYTKKFSDGRDWANLVLIVNMSENLRLVSTSMPNN